jgi:hypothetical protein
MQQSTGLRWLVWQLCDLYHRETGHSRAVLRMPFPLASILDLRVDPSPIGFPLLVPRAESKGASGIEGPSPQGEDAELVRNLCRGAATRRKPRLPAEPVRRYVAAL